MKPSYDEMRAKVTKCLASNIDRLTNLALDAYSAGYRDRVLDTRSCYDIFADAEGIWELARRISRMSGDMLSSLFGVYTLEDLFYAYTLREVKSMLSDKVKIEIKCSPCLHCKFGVGGKPDYSQVSCCDCTAEPKED